VEVDQLIPNPEAEPKATPDAGADAPVVNPQDSIVNWLHEVTKTTDTAKAQKTIENQVSLLGTQGQELGDLRATLAELKGVVKSLADGKVVDSQTMKSVGEGIFTDEAEENAAEELSTNPLKFMTKTLIPAIEERFAKAVGMAVESATAPVKAQQQQVATERYQSQMKEKYKTSWDALSGRRRELFTAADSGTLGAEEFYQLAALGYEIWTRGLPGTTTPGTPDNVPISPVGAATGIQTQTTPAVANQDAKNLMSILDEIDNTMPGI